VRPNIKPLIEMRVYSEDKLKEGRGIRGGVGEPGNRRSLTTGDIHSRWGGDGGERGGKKCIYDGARTM